MTVRFAWCLAALTLLGGCVETALVCGPGLVRNADGRCVADPVDSGRHEDAGRDANVPVDGGPCDPACAGGEVCVEIDEDTFECVECASDDDCGGRFCGSAHTCVDCTEHAHCTDPEAGQCLDGSCAPCAAPDHCAGTTGTICDASRTPATCVACTVSELAACTAAQTCDLVSGQCAGVAPLTLGPCEACTNDLQCMTGMRCIELTYMGAAHGTGGYCLEEAPGCARPFMTPITRASLNGAAAVTYCGINEALTTCEAVRALQANDGCTVDGDCPAGGVCRDLGGGVVTDRCTYRCGSGDDCLDMTTRPAQSTCGNGGSGFSFCGG